MSGQEMVLWFGALALVSTAITLGIVLHYRLRHATSEYNQARGLVESIVTTFRRRYDTVLEDLRLADEHANVAVVMSEQNTKLLTVLDGELKQTTSKIGLLSNADKNVLSEISLLHDECKKLGEAQDQLREKISFRNLKPLELGDVVHKEVEDKESRLTETERAILQFLISEGPKTAKEVEAKIGKTREHTARLMKKLWQEGYVERETHKIPFSYRATDSLKGLETSPV